MSEAPKELWADWDYEGTDGVCGVHTHKKYASGYEPECPPIRYVRADHIKELEKELALLESSRTTLYQGWRISNHARIDAEAKLRVITERSNEVELANVELGEKLAKAVEALQFYAWENEARLPSDGPWGAGSTDFGKIARTTLAALKGQDDE